MSKKKKEHVSKRQMLREKHRKKARQQRLVVIFGVLIIVIVVVGLLVGSSIRESLRPVGEFVKITPTSYPMEDGTSLGNPDAAVKIVVFEDFKCIACKGYSESIEPDVIQNLIASGDVYYSFRQYPFLDDSTSIKDSDHAANAAMCAAEQNRFWDYKTMLFANFNGVPSEFSNKRLVAFAAELDLDMDTFNDCINENRYQDVINEDVGLGEQWGVTGTPSIFVNSKIVKPGFVPSFEEIKAAVDEALGSSGS